MFLLSMLTLDVLKFSALGVNRTLRNSAQGATCQSVYRLQQTGNPDKHGLIGASEMVQRYDGHLSARVVQRSYLKAMLVIRLSTLPSPLYHRCSSTYYFAKFTGVLNGHYLSRFSRRSKIVKVSLIIWFTQLQNTHAVICRNPGNTKVN